MQTERDVTLADVLTDRRAELAAAITERHYQIRPELMERYGERGRIKCLQDAEYHLSYLAEAAEAVRPALFADYISWAKVMLAGRGVPASDLADNLAVMREAITAELGIEHGRSAAEYINAALTRIEGTPASLPSYIDGTGPLGPTAEDYLNALLRGDRSTASRLITDAAASGIGIRDIYIDVFQRSQHEIGRLWQENRLSVAQEHYCTAATQMIMSQLYPHIFTSDKNGRTMVAACVSGDLHEIGVRMVADFFEMEGWDTFYLGANTPIPDTVKTLGERDADLLVVSATMTFHVRAVRDLITSVQASGWDGHVLVGGYPFNIEPNLWKDVGADGWAPDAREAVRVGTELVTAGR